MKELKKFLFFLFISLGVSIACLFFSCAIFFILFVFFIGSLDHSLPIRILFIFFIAEPALLFGFFAYLLNRKEKEKAVVYLLAGILTEFIVLSIFFQSPFRAIQFLFELFFSF